MLAHRCILLARLHRRYSNLLRVCPTAHTGMKRTVMTEEGGSEVATEPKRAKDEACVAEQESSEVRGGGQFGISARRGKKERREKQFDWSL